MSHSAAQHYHTMGYRRKPAPPKQRSTKRSSGRQSASTTIDFSPIISTPRSADWDQNLFTESVTGSSEWSVASSAYSTESKLATAKIKAKQQQQELREIRGKSKSVQDFLMEKLQHAESRSRVDTAGLDYYEQELERMKDSLCSVQVAEPLFKNSVDEPKPDLTHELLQMQREIRHIRDSLRSKQSDLRKQEQESAELKQVVRSLQRTVLDLGGSVDYAGVEVEARKTHAGNCSCTVF